MGDAGSLAALVGGITAGLGPEPGPAPAGEALRLRVTCATSPDPAAATTRHDVVIGPDWSVETPHDLEAERWAVALGGHLSCLALVDDVVPAVRGVMSLLARRTLPPVSWDGRPARWRPAPRARACCLRLRDDDVTRVAAHVRGAEHVAARSGAEPMLVREVLAAVTRAHGGDPRPPEETFADAARRCTRGRLDAAALWEAGLHPALVVAVHDAVGAAGRLPARFYLGVMSRRPDLAWVADTLAAADDDEAAEPPTVESPWVTTDRVDEPLASWLVWSSTEADRVDPTLRRRWLAAGVSRPLVLALSEAGYSPDDVAALAAGWRRTGDGAARSLAVWVHAGAHPTTADLLALEARGVPSFAAPAAAAISRVRSLAGGAALGVDDTEVALLVAAAGTVPHAAAALLAGDADWRAASWRPPTRHTGAAGIGSRSTEERARKGA